MKKTNLKVVILGYGPMLTNLIAGTLDVGAKVVGVFRHEKVVCSPLELFFEDLFNQSKELSYIKSHNLYEIKAKSVNSAEFKKEIIKLNADLVLVGSWSEKFKKHIINIPPMGTINVHPSLLPKYRGPNPYLQAIKNLEMKSGVTFHLMDENLDTGAMLLQKEVKINQKDTGVELKDKITKATRIGVMELLKELNEDIIIPVKQDESKASYFKHIEENEVMLDFSDSAGKIAAKIRAFHPWHKCYFRHNSHFFIPNPYKLKISDNFTNEKKAGKIIEKNQKEKSISILCADNKILKMSDINLFGPFNKLFTKLYIKLRVKKFNHVN